MHVQNEIAVELVKVLDTIYVCNEGICLAVVKNTPYLSRLDLADDSGIAFGS